MDMAYQCISNQKIRRTIELRLSLLLLFFSLSDCPQIFSLYVTIFPDPLDQGSAGKSPARYALPGKDLLLHTARPIVKDRSSLGSFPGLIDDWRVVASSTRYIRTRHSQEVR